MISAIPVQDSLGPSISKDYQQKILDMGDFSSKEISKNYSHG